MLHLKMRYFIFVVSTLAGSALAQDDDPRKSHLACQLDTATQQVTCDYRYPFLMEVKDVSLKVGGQPVQLEQKDIALYPTEGQTSAILFLVDISDPARKNTVEKKNVPLIKDMVALQKPHQLIGLASFDSEFRLLTPLTNDAEAIQAGIKEIKAAGVATEYYKNILTAIELLSKTQATRKALVLMSDGKDEDKAYTRDDVLKAAKEAGVSILGIGYRERKSDSPYLQNVQKIAIETAGQYVDGSEGLYPTSLTTDPFGFVERGGRINFSGLSYNAPQDVLIVLGTRAEKPIELSTRVDFPDKRTTAEKYKEYLKTYLLYVILGGVALLAVIAYCIYFLTKRKKTEEPSIEYAYLEEMSGAKTRHSLTKTAVRIGRSVDNDVHLPNDSISSHHAEIHRRREGDFYIVDLSSTNGVFVNEQVVTQTELNDGDLIELGEVRLYFYIN
jgi:Mg-chelatase subunit ChlD